MTSPSNSNSNVVANDVADRRQNWLTTARAAVSETRDCLWRQMCSHKYIVTGFFWVIELVLIFLMVFKLIQHTMMSYACRERLPECRFHEVPVSEILAVMFLLLVLLVMFVVLHCIFVQNNRMRWYEPLNFVAYCCGQSEVPPPPPTNDQQPLELDSAFSPHSRFSLDGESWLEEEISFSDLLASRHPSEPPTYEEIAFQRLDDAGSLHETVEPPQSNQKNDVDNEPPQPEEYAGDESQQLSSNPGNSNDENGLQSNNEENEGVSSHPGNENSQSPNRDPNSENLL